MCIERNCSRQLSNSRFFYVFCCERRQQRKICLWSISKCCTCSVRHHCCCCRCYNYNHCRLCPYVAFSFRLFWYRISGFRLKLQPVNARRALNKFWSSFWMFVVSVGTRYDGRPNHIIILWFSERVHSPLAQIKTSVHADRYRSTIGSSMLERYFNGCALQKSLESFTNEINQETSIYPRHRCTSPFLH